MSQTGEPEAIEHAEAYEKAPETPKTKEDDVESAVKTPRCGNRVVGGVCIGVGALLVVFSLVYGLAMPSIVNHKIDNSMFWCSEKDLKKTSFTDRYGDCADCNPFYFNLYFFNVTNAEEYLQGAKLRVQEQGPYAYRRYEIRVNATIDNNDWMTYKQYSYHKFDKEHSCATCSDTDLIMNWDVGYMSVMAQAGGEKGFLRRLIKGTMWGAKLSIDDMDKIIAKNGTQIMKWVNGLNSYDPAASQTVSSTVLPFLSMGMDSISSLNLTGLAYNGLFNLRPVSDYALGYPSLLVGLSLGTNYISKCKTGLNAQCAACKGAECISIAGDCKRCKMGAQTVALNTETCKRLHTSIAGKLGATAADSFVGSTCGTMCDSVGLCAAPLPGYAEQSGLDFSSNAPPAEAMHTFVQNSGCHDKSLIGEYKEYDGYMATPLWVNLGARRNPTLEEINALSTYATCTNSPANLTCSVVNGNDATAVAPRHASMTGFPSKVTDPIIMMYVSQAYQNVTLFNTQQQVKDFEGISLTRFTPDRYLMNEYPWLDSKGGGFPVDGVQPLTFVTGFLSFMSYPFFFYANETLADHVEMTMYNGVKASKDVFFESNGVDLKKDIFDRYATFVDVEPGTGRAMRGRKRLQASYALSKSQFSEGLAMTDVMYPNLTTEVLAPMFFGEESATAKSKTVDTFKGLKRVLASLIPVLIIGCVLGVALIVYGVIYYRRRNQDSATTTEGV